MKRKYYMRGLGIGMIITALFFSVFSPKKKEKLTDSEIITRAKELGYVYKEQKSSVDEIAKIKEEQQAAAQNEQNALSGNQSSEKEQKQTKQNTAEPEEPEAPSEPEAPEAPKEPKEPEVSRND